MKKVLSLILCFAFIFCIFAGCSGNDEKEPKSTTGPVSLQFTTDESNSYLSPSSVRAYETLCDAVINGKSEANFNTTLINDVNRLFYSDFPLSCLVSKMDLKSDNTGVSIVYKNNTDEHLRLVSEFSAKVNEILSECGFGKVNNNVLVLNLYSYITKNTEINNQSNNTYDVIVNSTGYSSSFAGAFAYLLNQAGVKASVVKSTNDDGIAFMAETDFKGMNYIFNPYFEANDNKGEALRYFALDYADMASAGYTDVRYRNDDSVVFDDGENDFARLRSSVSYTLDGNSLSVKTENGDFQIEL